MSLGPIVTYIGSDNSLINYETSGCRLDNYQVVCDGDNYDPDNLFQMYGIRVYLLDQSIDFSGMSVSNQPSIVIQGDSITLYYGSTHLTSSAFFSQEMGLTSIEEGLSMFSDVILYANIFASFLNNLIVISLIIFVSTLMFIRYRKEISYGRIYKLTAMAATPIALLITFFNIVPFSDWVFFILGFFAYLPMFKLNREIFYQSMARKYQDEQGNVVDSYQHEDVETKDIDQDDDDEQQ